ncbi:MAG: isoprenylcysteine carboxylmethyltransferase family protein [Desulfarculus sp.]|nr:isoprenylcysteine carboxylmethyltransferase family protein [Desulfarculus sp.]
MNALELKIPPVVVTLIAALGMWGASLAVPSFHLSVTARASAGAILVAVGLGIVVAGGISFRRARTTVNPTKPGSTSSLVVSGVYRFTRNPMYLGMVFALLGWASFLLNALAFVLIPGFVVYLNRFQIAPEERALSSLFGAEYVSYQARVRRWL